MDYYQKRENDLKVIENRVKEDLEKAIIRLKTYSNSKNAKKNPETLERYRTLAKSANDLLLVVKRLRERNRKEYHEQLRLEPFHSFGRSSYRPNIQFEQIICTLLLGATSASLDRNRLLCSEWLNTRWQKELDLILDINRSNLMNITSPHMIFFIAKLIDFSILYLKEWNKRRRRPEQKRNSHSFSSSQIERDIRELENLQKLQQEKIQVDSYYSKQDPLYIEIMNSLFYQHGRNRRTYYSSFSSSFNELEDHLRMILSQPTKYAKRFLIAQNRKCKMNMETLIREVASWFFGIAGIQRNRPIHSTTTSKRIREENVIATTSTTEETKNLFYLRFYGHPSTSFSFCQSSSASASAFKGMEYERIGSKSISELNGNGGSGSGSGFIDEVRLGSQIIFILRKTTKEIPWILLSFRNQNVAKQMDSYFQPIQDEIEFYTTFGMPLLSSLKTQSSFALLRMISCSIPNYTANPNETIVSYNICLKFGKEYRKAIRKDFTIENKKTIDRTIDALERESCPFLFEDIISLDDKVYLINWKRNNTSETIKQRFDKIAATVAAAVAVNAVP